MSEYQPGAMNIAAERRSSHTRTIDSHHSFGVRAHSCDTNAPTGLLPDKYRSVRAVLPKRHVPVAPNRRTCDKLSRCKYVGEKKEIKINGYFWISCEILVEKCVVVRFREKINYV